MDITLRMSDHALTARAAAAAGRRCALPAELCAAPDRFRHSYDAVCGVAAVRHGPAGQL